MYVFEDMIDLGLGEGDEWTSDDHRKVASTVCLCNPHICSRNQLIHNVGIINKIPQEEIRTVEVADLLRMGCEI